MFYIGEFSQMSKTTIKTLHYYDRIGLLRPEQIDVLTGYRIYTSKQLLRLHYIQSLRQAGLSIDEVRRVVKGASIEPILEDRKIQTQRELKKYEDQLARIHFIQSHLNEEYCMNYQATIKEVPAHIVFTKRLTVPDHAAYFEVIPAIGRAVRVTNPSLECAKPEYCYISYLDTEYKETDINIEYNEAVLHKGVEAEGIFFRDITPATVVSVLHKGPYANLLQAYAYAMDWVEKNGYTVADMPRESYIDGIWNKQEESEWLTEIQVPITK